VCGRFSLAASGEELAEAFGLAEGTVAVPRYNIAPSQPVLTVRDEGGRRRALSLRWGLSGAPGEGPSLLINARAETVAARPAFRESFRRRRCLVPADGFYEWRKERGASQPFHIRRRDRALFAFAGLWAPAPETDGACVIVTTEPNAAVSPIHDRMPVILPRTAWGPWLDAAAGVPALERLLRPLADGELEAVPVSDLVNSTANDGPQCLGPAPERPVQGLLFPEMRS
jgi:putative SOS response-associated peptidase YedK